MNWRAPILLALPALAAGATLLSVASASADTPTPTATATATATTTPTATATATATTTTTTTTTATATATKTAAAPTVIATAPPTGGTTGVITLTATLFDASGKALGPVQLTQRSDGKVDVLVEVTGLPAGDHGIHIHAAGKCEGLDFASAGGHFNPTNKKHGLNAAEGHHGGDLPGLTVAANGTAVYRAATSDVTLSSGPNSIVNAGGSALVIHAGADDQTTDPSGNSGARIACAVLSAPNPALAPLPPNTGSGMTDGNVSMQWALVVGMAGLLIAGAGVSVLASRRS